MGAYKLLALDMDGTLLTEAKEISKENKDAIHAAIEAGITVMFSTGRGVQSAMPYVVELGLESPMVAVNGSEVWESPGKLHSRTLLSPDTVSRLHRMAVEHDCWWWAYAVDGIYNRDNETRDFESHEWLKFGYYTENANKLKTIRQTAESWGILEITNSHPCNIELNPKGISKASGLETVCKLRGISMSEVIAMGDSENDITMIQAAGLGVAMGNAQEGVKKLADAVTATNEEHGVAKVIQEYLLR